MSKPSRMWRGGTRARAWQRDDARVKREKPGQHRLRRACAQPLRRLRERRIAREAPGAHGTAEGRVRQHPQTALEGERDHSSAQRLVIAGPERHLDGGERGELESLCELAPIDVGDADAADPSALDERGERTHAGRERNARIGSVQ